MEKAFKYRIYPNAAQRELIEKAFGRCRWVYNKVLGLQQGTWSTTRYLRYDKQNTQPGYRQGTSTHMAPSSLVVLALPWQEYSACTIRR